jgi:peptidyl-prolyl cis-trans isomerase D
VEARRLLAEEIASRAKAGEDFAELAKSFSEGPTRDNGGWLGAFKREDMVKPFSDAAFGLEEGGISDPVKTQFGWHVIKVEKKNAGGTRSLEQVKEEIRAMLKSAEAKNLAYDEAVAVFDSTLDGEPLPDTADEAVVRETEIFGRQGPQGVADPVGFAQAAFKLDVLGISDITELGDGYYIIQVTEKIPSELQPLADVEARVTADLLAEQQDQAAAAAAEEFLASLKDGGRLEDLASALGREVATTDYFKRTGSIPGLGFEKQISETAFELSDQKPVADSAVKGTQGYYVIRLKDKKVPPPEEFEKEKGAVKDELIRRKQIKTFEAWLAKHRSESEIVIEEGFTE